MSNKTVMFTASTNTLFGTHDHPYTDEHLLPIPLPDPKHRSQPLVQPTSNVVVEHAHAALVAGAAAGCGVGEC
eukprot:jgi/Chrzof1/5903/Cz16g20040.t1